MERKLYKIGQLSRLSSVSSRTIDYYTKLGLIQPEKRSDSNYRYYSDETLLRLKRIEMMKKEKYTLEEIKACLDQFEKVGQSEQVTDKLSALQLHLQQLEKEVKEISPMIESMRPSQAKNLYKIIAPSGAAVIEALLILLDRGSIL
ncbi:MAG: MerR family transcriptional regulator [Paenibacillaceae bacterium]|nr:MerR family transcriptional regulator [Paenibacillaceae bacterium]